MAENNKRALLQGNEACVEGALAAGMRFFSGYPITPSTEIAEGCALNLPKVGGKFVQMEDEIGGIAVDIADRVVEREVREEDHRALIDDFIRQVGDAS